MTGSNLKAHPDQDFEAAMFIFLSLLLHHGAPYLYLHFNDFIITTNTPPRAPRQGYSQSKSTEGVIMMSLFERRHQYI
jgi:hypothetical protein